MRVKLLVSVLIGVSADLFAQNPFPYVRKANFQDELRYEQSV